MCDAEGIVERVIVSIEVAALMRGQAEQPCLVDAKPLGQGVDTFVNRVEKFIGIASAVLVGPTPPVRTSWN